MKDHKMFYPYVLLYREALPVLLRSRQVFPSRIYIYHVGNIEKEDVGW